MSNRISVRVVVSVGNVEHGDCRLGMKAVVKKVSRVYCKVDPRPHTGHFPTARDSKVAKYADDTN